MTYQYRDEQTGVTTIVVDEALANAMRANRWPIAWRTIEDEWSRDYRTRRIIQAEIMGSR